MSKQTNNQPKASRPHMKGYGVPKSMAGALSWDWAEKRLTDSHNYWLTSVRPDGAPHAMPIWGIWLDGAYYFSTSATSRKRRNLARNPHCVICNENAAEAVIMEGVAQQPKEEEVPKQAFTDYKRKYGWDLDPKLGPVWMVRPKIVFAMPEKQFPKGVTRWKFE